MEVNVIKEIVTVVTNNDIVEVYIFDYLIQNVTSTGGVRIETDFDFNDIAAGFKLIGSISGKRILRVALIINTIFDGGLQITIGDSAAQARLMVIADNSPDSSNVYVTEPDEYYSTVTNLNLYFPIGNPTVGSGTAVIYYL